MGMLAKGNGMINGSISEEERQRKLEETRLARRQGMAAHLKPEDSESMEKMPVSEKKEELSKPKEKVAVAPKKVKESKVKSKSIPKQESSSGQTVSSTDESGKDTPEDVVVDKDKETDSIYVRLNKKTCQCLRIAASLESSTSIQMIVQAAVDEYFENKRPEIIAIVNSLS